MKALFNLLILFALTFISISTSEARVLRALEDLTLDVDTGFNIIMSAPSLSTSSPLKLGASQELVTGDIDLTSEVTGILPVANGGTGSATQNFVDLTTNQTIEGDKIVSGTLTTTLPFSAGQYPTASLPSAASYDGYIVYDTTTQTYKYSDGVSWTVLGAGGGMTNPLTTTGDIIYSSSGTTPARLGVGTNGQVLTLAAGIPSWATISGTGDVVGPASAVDSNVVMFDGVTGKLIKDSGVTLSGTNTGDQTSVTGTSGTTDALNSATTIVDVSAATAPTVGQVLTATSGTAATWQTVSGTGDVVGPASAVDNNVVFFDGVTGKLIKDSTLTLSGTNTGDQTSVTGTSGNTDALNSATTVIDVSTATAPTVGQVLTATSATSATWQAPISGFSNPMTTDGDMMYTSGTAATRLPIGTNGDVLTVTGGIPVWTAGGGGGAGDVVGPASATDNALPRFDSTTGKLIQNSNVLVDDDGRMSQTALGSSTFFGINSGSVDDLSNNFNTGFGRDTLTNTTTGSNNTAVGYDVLRVNITGSNSTAVGQAALQNSTNGSNTAVGYASGKDITTGLTNVAVGGQTLWTLTSGSGNTALGWLAGKGGTAATGANNTFIGYGTGLAFTTGARNTLIGYSAGDAITTGTDNIIIGYNAAATSATATNELNIGGAVLGDLSVGSVITGSVLSAAHFTTGALPAAASYEGYLAYDTTSQTYKFSNGSAWGEVAGGGAPATVYSNPNPLYVNSEIFGASATATAIGAASFGNTAAAGGTSSTAIGNNSAATGNFSTAIGPSTSAMVNSTAIGYLATANGTQASAIGYNADADVFTNSVAIGANTTITGNGGVAIGLAANAGAIGTAVGPDTVATGTNATALGSAASATGNVTISLGANSTATSSYTVNLGAFTDNNAFGSTINVGAYAEASKANQMTIGSWVAPIKEIIFGKGSFYNGARDDVTLTTTAPITGTDLSGKDLIILGSGRTGAGLGGSVLIKTVIAGTTGTVQSLVGQEMFEANTAGEIVLNAEASPTADASLWTNSLSMSLNETDDDIDVKTKDSGSTVRSLSITAKNRYETKQLTSDITTLIDLSDLTFTGLTVGKQYMLTGQISTIVSNNGIQVDFRSAASGIGTQYGAVRFSDGAVNTGIDNFSVVFEAVSTSLYLNASVNGGTIFGNSTANETFATLTELNNTEVTTAF